MNDRRTRNYLRELVQTLAPLAHSGQVSHYVAARVLRNHGASLEVARRVLLGVA